VFANLTRVNSKLKAPVPANNVKGMPPPPRAVTGTRR
jgi:hypothetical protein